MDRTTVAQVAVVVAFLNTAVAADTNTQFWSEVTLAWARSHHLTLSADIEPKVVVAKPAGDPQWWTLDVTSTIEVARGNWLDVTGDVKTGYTQQTNDVNTTEVTPRLGVRVHILSNLREDLRGERVPKQRVVLRNNLRFEWRNLYYSNDQPKQFAFRIRDRVEAEYPLNKRRVTDDGAIYVLGDAEWFWTTDDLDERFASKERFRAGVGHRRNVRWRFETLFVLDRTRKEPTDDFTSADYALDVRVRHTW